jgi:chemosensory pili system protein ChpA (sensor histidine kinase/response regulator)
VRDDGEGIDETDVLLRAVKLELISAEQARKVPKGQGVKYIFMPGYSGEKQAFGVAENSISLDQIRRKVKRHGGSISLQNLPGSYCQLSVRFLKDIA